MNPISGGVTGLFKFVFRRNNEESIASPAAANERNSGSKNVKRLGVIFKCRGASFLLYANNTMASKSIVLI